MNLSPEQKSKVIAAVAEMLVEELRDDMGGTFTNLYVIPLAVAEKMLGIGRSTIRQSMAVVELTPGKHGVRLSVLQEFIERRTNDPAQPKKRRVA